MTPINGKRLAFLSETRRREIADLAEAVADEHCPGAVIDPLAIARSKQISWSFGDYQEAFDGLLEHLSGRFHIYCNLARVGAPNSPRARFTLAHELGHFYIDEHRNALKTGRAPAHPSFCEFESRNLVECEADHFAANLLMPTRRFKRLAESAPAGLGGILNLARRFATSITSTAIRYVTLRIKPSVALKWTKANLDWKWLSYEAREAGYKKTIESGSKLVTGSATARALAGEQPPASGFFQNGTVASAWFPFVPGGAWRDIILIEQAVSLGRFGVLTFLFPEQGTFPGVY